jgi:hypothetical protein
MWLSAASLAWLFVAAPPARDTTFTVTIRGIVLEVTDSSRQADRPVVLLSKPLLVGHDRIWMLDVAGDPKRMERWENRFVEATGSVTMAPSGRLALTPTRVQEAKPDGLVRREADPSFSQHAVVTLSLIPDHFAVRLNEGGNRVSPVALYTVANYSQTDLEYQFSTGEFVCISLSREGEASPRWTGAWKPSHPSQHLTIRMGPAFRAVMPIPADQLAWPGHYTVRASLCGMAEYAAVVPLVLTTE